MIEVNYPGRKRYILMVQGQERTLMLNIADTLLERREKFRDKQVLGAAKIPAAMSRERK
jgi:hypothetical protein